MFKACLILAFATKVFAATNQFDRDAIISAAEKGKAPPKYHAHQSTESIRWY
jgi:imidazolonepropionase-like amidohydrolase